MSEFSESYHLKDGSLDDVVALIKRSGQTGYAAKVCDGWATAIPESAVCGFSHDEDFVKGNTGILLHYNHPEDHGFSFTLFRGSQMVAHYSYALDNISGEDDFLSAIHTEGLNGAELIELLGLKFSEKDLLRLLVPEAPSGLWDIPDNFMGLLGILPESYSWKSSHYCELEMKEGSPLFLRVE